MCWYVKLLQRSLYNILQIESREEGKVKVCDFGLSKVIRPQDTHMTANLGGSPVYAAPELNSTTHTNKVDVYSFAIMCVHISLEGF